MLACCEHGRRPRPYSDRASLSYNFDAVHTARSHRKDAMSMSSASRARWRKRAVSEYLTRLSMKDAWSSTS